MATTDIMPTFLVGFGWQGALSAIEGSSASRAKEAEVDKDKIKNIADDTARIKDEARRAEDERRDEAISRIEGGI